jgi:mannonate dehydratase
MTRREFASSAAVLAAPAPAKPARTPFPEFEPGLKIAWQAGSDPRPEDLDFVKEVGLNWVTLNTSGAAATLDNFKRIKGNVEAAGIRVWNIGNANVHNMEEVTLNLPGRDAKVAEFQQYLRNLSAAGLRYTTYTHMGDGIGSAERAAIRGSRLRAYTEKEIWDNYTHWVERAAPVAEQVGVRIGIHPDDSPADASGGVPRCLFGSFAGYKRALEIANSPNIGVCLCCGCWLEGGDRMGADVITAIRYFAERNQLWKIHLRNLDEPPPHSTATDPGGRSIGMYQILKTLVEVDFRGAVIVDHIPNKAAGSKFAWAQQLSHTRRLLARAMSEVKRPAGSFRPAV